MQSQAQVHTSMFPFYLYAELQSVHVSVVQDNAKTHKKKESPGRRQLFARSRSEPFIGARKSSLARGGRSSRSIQQRPRPPMNRWNSFSDRSSTPFLQEGDESDFSEKAKTSDSLMVNAPKPVRRGSWGSSDFVTSPSRKKTSLQTNKEAEVICGSPMAPRVVLSQTLRIENIA